MSKNQVLLITGTRKGIGKYLVEYYIKKGLKVIGCSRKPVDYELDNYQHYCLDVTGESLAKELFFNIRKTYGQLDVLINNAGVASMNHALLTPMSTVTNNVAAVMVYGEKKTSSPEISSALK